MVINLNDTQRMIMTIMMIMTMIMMMMNMIIDINDTYRLNFHAKSLVYFKNKLMRTHLVNLL